MPDDFPWPDPVTLAAGDEDLLREPDPVELFWSRLYDGSPRIAETGDEGANFEALAALPKIRFVCEVCGEVEDGGCACCRAAGEEHMRRYHPTPFEKAQMRGYQEPGDLAVFAYERDHPQADA